MPSTIRQTKTAAIASGQSLSGVVALGDQLLCGILMPAAWDAADLTFQASMDGTNFTNVYDDNDVELTVQAGQARYIQLIPEEWAFANYIKVRSGTSSVAVNQTANRTVTLITRSFK